MWCPNKGGVDRRAGEVVVHCGLASSWWIATRGSSVAAAATRTGAAPASASVARSRISACAIASSL